VSPQGKSPGGAKKTIKGKTEKKKIPELKYSVGRGAGRKRTPNAYKATQEKGLHGGGGGYERKKKKIT